MVNFALRLEVGELALYCMARGYRGEHKGDCSQCESMESLRSQTLPRSTAGVRVKHMYVSSAKKNYPPLTQSVIFLIL